MFISRELGSCSNEALMSENKLSTVTVSAHNSSSLSVSIIQLVSSEPAVQKVTERTTHKHTPRDWVDSS